MTEKTIRKIAILGTGDMGSAVAMSLQQNGLQTLTYLGGRSERSIALANKAGMEQKDSLNALVLDADVLLSIVPPATAVEFATEVCPLIAKAPNKPLFVDCNAVSPMTIGRIEAIAARHDVRFQDVGIIGAAPRPQRTAVRFYTSGEWIGTMQQLATNRIEIRPLGAEIGRASAIKMVYASLTKGTHALRAAAALAGEQLGVGAEVLAEWQRSLPGTYDAMQKRLPILASDSARWAGEMREISETYSSIGLPGSFHEGAEWLYELLAETPLAGESREEASDKDRAMHQVLEEFGRALQSRRIT